MFHGGISQQRKVKRESNPHPAHNSAENTQFIKNLCQRHKPVLCVAGSGLVLLKCQSSKLSVVHLSFIGINF